MTVRYEDRIRHFLFRWRGSVWRLVWRDLVVFCVLYIIISCIYHKCNWTDVQRKNYQLVVDQFYDISKTMITILSLLLGFYVNNMVNRWWTQFELIPWPEDLLGFITFDIADADGESRLVRRTIARYFCLTTALAGRHFSPILYKRFPTEDHLINFGLMTVEELDLYNKSTADVKWLLPIQWMQKLVIKATQKYNISPNHSVRLQQEMNDCMIRFRRLFCYDWISIPLVYTQVVTIAVYSYFVVCLIGHQTYNGDKHIDYYIPVTTALQILFFLGWFRVGQHIMKPFGFDDEDIELSALLDRHIEVAFAVADHPCHDAPPLSETVPKTISLITANGYHESHPLYDPLCAVSLRQMNDEAGLHHDQNMLKRIIFSK